MWRPKKSNERKLKIPASGLLPTGLRVAMTFLMRKVVFDSTDELLDKKTTQPKYRNCMSELLSTDHQMWSSSSQAQANEGNAHDSTRVNGHTNPMRQWGWSPRDQAQIIAGQPKVLRGEKPRQALVDEPKPPRAKLKVLLGGWSPRFKTTIQIH